MLNQQLISNYELDNKNKNYYRKLNKDIIKKYRKILQFCDFNIGEQKLLYIENKKINPFIKYLNLRNNRLVKKHLYKYKDSNNVLRYGEKNFIINYNPLYDNKVVIKHLFASQVKNKIKDINLNAHYLHESIFGFELNKNSDCLVVGINEFLDDKNPKQTLINFLNLIKFKGVFLIEQSSLNNFRVYIKCKRSLHDKTRQNLKFKLIEQNINTEILNVIYQAPFSIMYKAIDILNLKKTNKIEYYKSKEAALEITYNTINKLIPLSVIALCNKTGLYIDKNKIKKSEQPTFIRLKDESVITKEQLLEKFKTEDKYKISNHNRFNPMLAIIRDGTCKGIDEEQLLKIIRENNDPNNSSYDLECWNDEQLLFHIKCIKENWIKKYKKISKPDTFYYNESLIPIGIKQLCNSNVFSNQVIKNSNIKKLNKQQKVKFITKELLLYIIHKIIYNDQNNREINPTLNLTEEKKKLLLKGFQISNKEINLLKQKLELTNTDINRYFKAIMNLSIFKQFKHNNQGWNYGYINSCKQFELNLIKYENDIVKNIIYNLLLFINNNINFVVNICNHYINSIYYIKSFFNHSFNNIEFDST